MRGQVLVTAAALVCTAGLQLQGPSQSSDCYDGDRLFFVHVMKVGGSSADEWFHHMGEIMKFSVKYDEGPIKVTRGDTSCPTAVCTAHRKLADQPWVCDHRFKDAKTFTILREPVARVFSLFNYYKYDLKEKWMEKYSNFGDLLEFLEDPAMDDAFAKTAFMNTMTMYFFAPNAATLLFAYGERAETMIRSNYRVTQHDLEIAKTMLQQMNAIFFTERLSTWQDDYKNSGLPFAENAGFHKLSHEKRSDCAKDGCAEKATDAEIELATELNSLDVELYEFAKTLPQALGSEP